jgi:hypothetical protein
MRVFVFSLLLLFLCSSAIARSVRPREVRAFSVHHARLGKVTHSRRRAPVFSPIRGTRESLIHQNEMVERDNLDRIQNDSELEELTRDQQLLPLPGNRQILTAPDLPENRRYCRPWTRKFLNVFAAAHWARFHRPLQVNSAVRTVEFQEELRTFNGNAAPSDGDIASPHLTGATIDIAKRGMSRAELRWTRDYLWRLQKQGKLDAEEEFHQRCFHISVYRAFVPQVETRRRAPKV